MQVGDKAKHIINSTGFLYPHDVIYTIVELGAGDFVKVKHPEIGGHFYYNKKNLEVVCK